MFRDWFSRFTPLTPSPPGWLNPRKRGCQCEIGYKANLNVHWMDQSGGHGTGRSPVLPARTGNPPGWKTRKRGKPRHYQPLGQIQGSILPEWVSGTGFSNRRFSSTFPPPLTRVKHSERLPQAAQHPALLFSGVIGLLIASLLRESLVAADGGWGDRFNLNSAVGLTSTVGGDPNPCLVCLGVISLLRRSG